jgi:flagella basal body P-ring formation protein FlgA
MKPTFFLLPVLAAAAFLGASHAMAETSAAPAPFTLSLNSEAKVGGASITVGDVVTADPAIPAAVLQVPLGLAPNLNDTKTLSRLAVAATLAAHTELGAAAAPAWTGADQCVIRKPARVVAPQDLAAVLLTELQHATNGQGQVKIVEFASAGPVLLPQGRGGVSAQAQLDATALFHPWADAAVDYYVDGEKVASSTVRFRWSWQRPAWQAVRTIQAGEDFHPDDFRLTTVDAIKTGGSFFSDLPAIEGQVISHMLTAGAVLAPADLGPKKIVQRGEQVTVNYVQTSFKITMKAVALQDGVKGQVISVENTQSKKSLFAKVVDDATLEVVQ